MNDEVSKVIIIDNDLWQRGLLEIMCSRAAPSNDIISNNPLAIGLYLLLNRPQIITSLINKVPFMRNMSRSGCISGNQLALFFRLVVQNCITHSVLKTSNWSRKIQNTIK